MVIVLSDCDSDRLSLWRLRVQSAHRRDDGGVGGEYLRPCSIFDYGTPMLPKILVVQIKKI